MRPLATLLLVSRLALGCECDPFASTPLCQRIDRVQVLFIGTAIATNDNHDGFLKGGIWYRFSVDEVFKGLPSQTMEVIVDPASGTSCQEEFTVGTRYLISSYGPTVAAQMSVAVTLGGFPRVAGDMPPGPIVATGACSGSRELVRASDDAQFARQYLSAPKPATIFGFIRMNVDSMFSLNYPGVRGATVTVTGLGQQYSRQTDDEGRFEIGNVEAGTYSVAATRSGFKMEDAPPIVVPANGCGVANVALRTSGSLSGQVLQEDGRSASGIEVEYGYADPRFADSIRNHPVKTDSRGRFAFSGVPAGALRIGVHIRSAPDKELPYDTRQADIVTLSPNEERQGIVVRLGPRLKERRVQVRVRWPDGRPAEDVGVSAEVGESIGEFGRTDRDGQVTLTLLAGIGYGFRARGWSSYRTVSSGARVGERYVDAEPTPLAAGTAPAKIEMTLTRPQPVR